MLKKLKDRYTIIAIFFTLVGIIFTCQLVNLQIINGKENDDISQKRIIGRRNLVAQRGNIIDTNGVPIAVNRQAFTIQISEIKTKKKAEINEMLLKLTRVLEKNKDSYSMDLGKYLTIEPFAFGQSINTEKKIEKWKKDMSIKSADINTPEKVFRALRTTLEIPKEYSDKDAYNVMKIKYDMFIKGYSKTNPLYITKDAKQESIAEIEERNNEFPGVSTGVEPVREYVDAQWEANVIGYVGTISDEELKKHKAEGYTMNDIFGKSGIEYQAEKYLKGKDGYKAIEEDRSGRQTGELKGMGKNAVPGNDVELTLDTRLQKVAMQSLKNAIDNSRARTDQPNNLGDAFAGAAVAMNVNNGEVLAMASYPSYDPSVYLKSGYDKDARNLVTQWQNDKDNTPMFNRVIQGRYIPGSTFKPITGIAGIEEGATTPYDTIYDSGVLPIGNRTFLCLEYKNGQGAHGALTLERALATSCNIYFYKLALQLGDINKIDKWAKLFGLGELTGIDLPGEYKGIRSNSQYKQKVFKERWWDADSAQSAIGQLYHFYTPIELVNYISTLANGGKRFKPHVIKQIKGYDGKVISKTTPEYQQISIKQETLDAVRRGMVGVTNSADGTAMDVFKGFPITVAGKTGTPETGNEAKHSSNALFICYAPAEKPEIAIAVIIERGAWGANAAPVARDILTQYFDQNSQETTSDKIPGGEVTFTP